jgi:Arsenate reductase and related proteins, glutaredoxin family
MIKVIYKAGNRAKSKQESLLIESFEKNGIKVEKIPSHSINREELIQALILTYNGFDDIVVTRPQNEQLKQLKEICYDFNFNRAVEFLIGHPELVKTPIVYDEKNLVVSTRAEKIKKFMLKK